MPFNSTIIVNKKQLKCGCYDYNFSKGRCRTHATIEDSLIRMNERAEETGDLSDLIKELDAVFSRYIRQKSADKEGNAVCFTCDKKMRWVDLQNGHYISRGNMLLRFDERNCKPQCHTCNVHKRGNLLEYAKRLDAEKEGITEILYTEAKVVYHYSRYELTAMINDYSNKLKSLK